MRFMRKNKLGFNLVELLMVTSMLGIVSLAIFSTFNNGMKIWQKINKSLVEEDLGFFFDRLAQDLNNSFKSAMIPFTGNSDSLGVPTQVYSGDLKTTSMGLAAYFYDQQSGSVSRQPRDFSQLYSHHEGNAVVLLKNIEFLKFEYYYYDAQRQEYLWTDEWSQSSLPLAVRVELNLNESGQTNKFIRTFNVPISG